MDHPTIPSTLSRRSAWRHVAFALMGLALLGLALLPMAASANQQGTTVSDNSQWQIAICEAGGGKGAVIDVVRLPDFSVRSMQTKCTGGYFDGVTCWNSNGYGIECWKSKGATGHAVPVDLPLLSYAEGSQQGIDATVFALSQILQPAQTSATNQGATTHPAGQEQEQERGKAKGKGKHRGHGKGKKGGKGHRP